MKHSITSRGISKLTAIRGVAFAAAILVSLLAVTVKSQAIAAEQADGIRMMLKVQIPPDGGNQAIKAGNQGAIFEALIDKIKPEAV